MQVSLFRAFAGPLALSSLLLFTLGQTGATAGSAPLPGPNPAAAPGSNAAVVPPKVAVIPGQPAPVMAATNQAPAGPQPKIQFADQVYDFGRVASGELVKHDFVFTNSGAAKLVLTAVQPSCGCTAAGQWTREVEPGQTGRIPIQFNSSTFNGPVHKTVTVVCNDPTQNPAYLQLKGTVWKPIELNPPFAILNLTPDSSYAATTINITNNTEESVQVWDAQVSNPAFKVELRTNTPGKSYSMVVGLSGALKPGSIQGTVTAKSSATSAPVLTATTWANVQPPISLIPPTINLPQAPLGARTTPIVTVINNTTNPLALSDPEVNVPGVEVKVNEVQPGRYYSIVLAFPQGFELNGSDPVEFKVKSNNPKYPELKVPVHQAPKPANAPPATHASLVPPASIAAPPASIAAPRVGPGPVMTPLAVSSQTTSLTPPPSIAAPAAPVTQAPVRHVLPRTAPPPPPLPPDKPAPLKTAESVAR